MPNKAGERTVAGWWSLTDKCVAIFQAYGGVNSFRSHGCDLEDRIAYALSDVVKVVPLIDRRPANTPASQACCMRVFTRYVRLKSTAAPVIPINGIIAAATIASVLPA